MVFAIKRNVCDLPKYTKELLYWQKMLKSFKKPTSDCRCCFQFQFTPLHKAERRNHHSIVKLLLDHKARPTLQQPVRNIPMNIYILSCCLFFCSGFLNCVFVLCFKKYYMASAINSLVFTAGFVGSAYRWLWRNARHAMSKKKNWLCFLLFSLLNFACVEVSKIEFFPI